MTEQEELDATRRVELAITVYLATPRYQRLRPLLLARNELTRESYIRWADGTEQWITDIELYRRDIHVLDAIVEAPW